MTIQHTAPAHPAGHPFHDPREWEGPLAADAPDQQIAAGDLVQARRGRSTRTGVAVDRNGEGRWVDETGLVLIPKERSGALWEAWRIPSPGPEPLPIEPGRFIRAVTDAEGSTAEWLTLGLDGFFYGPFDAPVNPETGEEQVSPWRAEPIEILAFTDEDGTAWSREDATSAWAEVQA